MSSAACDNSAPCPPNFIAHTLTADLTLTVSQCSDELIGSAALVTQVMEFTFINADDDMTFIITDGTGTYKLAPYESVRAHCWSGGGVRLYFPEMSGSIGFCSAGCDAAAPTDRSGTAFGTTQNLIVATAALAETHVSKWETLSGPSGTCPRGCDVAAPQYESTTPNTFSVTQNLVVATAALAETHVSKWETLSGSSGTCPRGCDVVAPLYVSGSSFSVTQNLIFATADLAESWQLASGSGGYCPRGCDAVAPLYVSGSSFGVTQNLIPATAALTETHVSKWETLSGSSGTCPRGCDVAAPQYESTTPNTFSVTQNLVVATAALAETHVSKWETLSGSSGTCPRGCDVVAPLYVSGSSFSVTQNLVAATAVLAESWQLASDLAESWQLASGLGGYCPRGCDAAAPAYSSGNAFIVTQNLIPATTALAETNVSEWKTASGSAAGTTCSSLSVYGTVELGSSLSVYGIVYGTARFQPVCVWDCLWDGKVELQGGAVSLSVDGSYNSSLTLSAAGGTLNGEWTSDEMVTVSDRTLKLNVRPLREVLLQLAAGTTANETRRDSHFSEPSVSAVLRALKPVAFQYKSRPPEATGPSNGSQECLAGLERFGFVADELAETLPQLLRKVMWQCRSSTVKGVVYQDLIAVLTAVAQEHEARLEQWRINEQNVHRLLAEPWDAFRVQNKDKVNNKSK
ncbi:unnamed protein product [Polarella glacialis]|uniref:Peptidase S74 domain-containing protein n=1 Tax=Polarella glacialis TaxID=89957 RepID=A0A813I1B7_POLGL|nr:unnamed protein product [Polarella glacialis]